MKVKKAALLRPYFILKRQKIPTQINWPEPSDSISGGEIFPLLLRPPAKYPTAAVAPVKTEPIAAPGLYKTSRIPARINPGNKIPNNLRLDFLAFFGKKVEYVRELFNIDDDTFPEP